MLVAASPVCPNPCRMMECLAGRSGASLSLRHSKRDAGKRVVKVSLSMRIGGWSGGSVIGEVGGWRVLCAKYDTRVVLGVKTLDGVACFFC